MSLDSGAIGPDAFLRPRCESHGGPDYAIKVVSKVNQVASADISAQEAADAEARERKLKSNSREAAKHGGWGAAIRTSKLGHSAGVSSDPKGGTSAPSFRITPSLGQRPSVPTPQATLLSKPKAPKLLQRPDRYIFLPHAYWSTKYVMAIVYLFIYLTSVSIN